MDLAAIIDLHQISKTYPNQVQALEEVNFSATEQEFIGLAGANGSGKSTFLKIIAGQLKPDQGEALVFQRNAFRHAKDLTREVGYISQDWALDPEMSGQAVLDYFAALFGLGGAVGRQRCGQLTEEFAMQGFITRRISTYSGGQMQRLHLAIGLIHQPKLLLLDEPTNALDPSARALLWEWLKAYQHQGNTVLIASHDLDCIQHYCSRVLLFAEGRIVADAAPMVLVQAHSRPVLHLKTAEPLPKPDALLEGLRQVAEDVAFDGKAQTLSLTFSEADQAEMLLKTLPIFAAAGQRLAECRWEQPGLAQAYFKLTGNTPAPPQSVQTKKTQPGSRKRQ
jgi:ABC-2 type transport system ATP-binding protein